MNMHDLVTILSIPIFIILVVVIFRAIKDGMNFNTVSSVALSVAVSLLAVVGLNKHSQGYAGTILLPYAVLAICILLALLAAFLYRTFKKAKERFDGRSQNIRHTNARKKL